MSGPTKIEWTDAVWNPVTGCTKVSAGCKNCYAERIFHRPYPARSFADVRTHSDRLDWPLRWHGSKQAKAEGRRSRIFVVSMGDPFHPLVSFQFLDQMFAVMALAQDHTFQILTKRPFRMLQYLTNEAGPAGERWPISAQMVAGLLKRWDWMPGIGTCQPFGNRRDSLSQIIQSSKGKEGWPLPNVWLGVSVENQATANERIPHLLEIPAAIHFVSYEPALRFMTFPKWSLLPGKIGWVIVGGESGPNARFMTPEIARVTRNECVAANVPFFFKQWGKQLSGRILDGREWSQFPVD